MKKNLFLKTLFILIVTFNFLDAIGQTISQDEIVIIPSFHRRIIPTMPALSTMTAPAAVTISMPCGTSAVPSTLPFSNRLSGGSLISGTSDPSTFTAVAGTCGGTLTEK